jgi:transposase-like protein
VAWAAHAGGPTSTPARSPRCDGPSQGAAHQRCRVYFARNLLAHVPKTHADVAAGAFRIVFAQTEPATVARDPATVARDQLTGRVPKVGLVMDDTRTEASSTLQGRDAPCCSE